jgi:zinc protease
MTFHPVTWVACAVLSAAAASPARAEEGTPDVPTSSRKPAAAPAVAPDPALSQLFDVQESTLPNGMRVRLWPNPAVPTVSLHLFYRVGSRNERPGITGISHLFEHMMFNGSKKFGPRMFDLTLESAGGSSNAYTSTDLTVYHEEFAAEALETVLDLESDRMRALALSDKMLASEREVVKEERRLRVDNDVMGLLDEELQSLAFKAHPYRWPVIGWMADIDNIRREDCEQYFRTYYAPNNAVLYLSGAFEPKKARALIKKYFGTIKKGPPVPGVVDAEPEPLGVRRAEVSHPAQAPAVMVAHRGPAAAHADTLVLDVIQFAVSVGEGSRFTRDLVYKKELALSVGVDWSWRIDPGLFVTVAQLKPGGVAAEVEEAIQAEFEKIAKDGISDKELQKAKNNLRAQQLRELSTNGGRAHALGTYETFLGDWREALKLPNRYAAITHEQVKAAAAKYLSRDRRVTVTLKPLPTEGAAE